jgi:hypothetical protein
MDEMLQKMHNPTPLFATTLRNGFFFFARALKSRWRRKAGISEKLEKGLLAP